MAVANTKSTSIQNFEATPMIKDSVTNQEGRNRTRAETVAVAAADDDNSLYHFFKVNSNDSVKSLKVFNDAITGGTDYNVGLYDTDGATEVDDNLFADAISLATASTVGVEVRFEASDINTVNQKIWELLGLSEDPQKDYYLTLKGVTVGSAAGDISVIMEYVGNG